MSDNIIDALPPIESALEGQPSVDAAPPVETDPGVDVPAADDDSEADPDADQDNGDIGRARQQAARYRTRLRETEVERDQLRTELDAQRRAIVDWRASNRVSGPHVAPELLDAAGIDVAQLLDDSGHLDLDKVDQFVDATALRFGIPQGFRPNRAQGASGHAAPAASSLADAFRS